MWNLTSGNKNSADTINSSCSEEDDDEIKIRGFFSTDEEEAGDEVQLAGFFITKIISNEERVQVYQAKNIGTKETLAIKVVKIEDQDVTKHMAREMMIRDLKHQNVVGLKKVFLSDGGTKLCFVMEFLPMDLGDFMLVGSLGKTHFKQILEGICYLHAQGIIHRDLKPENILIDDDDKIGSCPLVKIADFGLARGFLSAGDGLSPSVGAVGYKAPEILLGSKHYTSAVDIWALGCIFAYSVTKRPLVAKEPDIPTLTQIFSILGKPEEEAWPEVSNLPGYETVSSFDLEPIGLEAHFPHVEPTLFDLLSRMLCLEPSRRITAKAALEHEYFAGMQ